MQYPYLSNEYLSYRSLGEPEMALRRFHRDLMTGLLPLGEETADNYLEVIESVEAQHTNRMFRDAFLLEDRFSLRAICKILRRGEEIARDYSAAILQCQYPEAPWSQFVSCPILIPPYRNLETYHSGVHENLRQCLIGPTCEVVSLLEEFRKFISRDCFDTWGYEIVRSFLCDAEHVFGKPIVEWPEYYPGTVFCRPTKAGRALAQWFWRHPRYPFVVSIWKTKYAQSHDILNEIMCSSSGKRASVLNHLRFFRAFATEGSLTKAAAVLGLGEDRHSQVSYHLKALATMLGLAIEPIRGLYRSCTTDGRPDSELTEAGRALHDWLKINPHFFD